MDERPCMNILKTFLTTSFLAVPLSFDAHADLVSEVGISISVEKTNTFLQELSGDFRVESEEIDFEGGGILGEVKKTGASISLDSAIDFELDGGDRVSAQIIFNELILSIQGFEYEDITIIKRSGVTARVKTKIRCSDLFISLKNWNGLMSVSMEYQDGDLLLRKEGGVFELEGKDLDLDFSNCVAPRGVDILFKDKILDWIKSAEGKNMLFEQALTYGQEFVDQNWKEIKKEELSFELFDRTLSLDLMSIDFFKGHLEAKGELRVLDDQKDYKITLKDQDFERAGEISTIILPKELFSKMVPDLMKSTPFSFNLKRSEIPGVDMLFNSRFIQFFVWSDLLNFKKSVDFNAGISLFTKKAQLKNSRRTGFSYYVKGSHKVDMDLLNSNGHPFPYLDFSGSVKTNVDLDLNDEGVSFKINKPSLSAGRSWDAKMFDWRKSRPGGKPWMRMITPRIGKALDQTEFKYSWEDMGLDGFIDNVEMEHLNEVVLLNVGLKK